MGMIITISIRVSAAYSTWIGETAVRGCTPEQQWAYPEVVFVRGRGWTCVGFGLSFGPPDRRMKWIVCGSERRRDTQQEMELEEVLTRQKELGSERSRLQRPAELANRFRA